MTYFRLGHTDISKSTAKRPFVEYSSQQDRASLMSAGGPSHRLRKRTRSAGKRKKSRVTKVRVVKGKVALRVGGFPGVQRVGASQLVRFVPLNKLRAAAKRVLGTPPKRVKRGRKGRKGKRRQ
jgi:hypothetical protein